MTKVIDKQNEDNKTGLKPSGRARKASMAGGAKPKRRSLDATGRRGAANSLRADGRIPLIARARRASRELTVEMAASSTDREQATEVAGGSPVDTAGVVVWRSCLLLEADIVGGAVCPSLSETTGLLKDTVESLGRIANSDEGGEPSELPDLLHEVISPVLDALEFASGSIEALKYSPDVGQRAGHLIIKTTTMFYPLGSPLPDLESEFG